MFFHQLWNELRKLFGKKRTYIGFGAFLVAQNAMLLAFRFTGWQKNLERTLSGNGYIPQDYVSALTVALIMLIPQAMLLMPLYAALAGGELVAKEAEDGTLRMILCRPVSRLRLMILKWLAGLIFAGLLVIALGVTALLFASFWFPWKGMFVIAPGMVFNVLSPGQALPLYCLSHAMMAVNACVILGLAFMFSCFNMKPAAAAILSLSFLFINLVMEGIPFFEEYHHFLLPYHFRVWILVYANPTPWPRILSSLAVLIGFLVTSFLVGATIFHARDIKS